METVKESSNFFIFDQGNLTELDLGHDLLSLYGRYMLLNIFIDSDDVELKNKYKEAVRNHHLKIMKDIQNVDAGFDLLSPSEFIFSSSCVNKLDYKISCSAQIVEGMHQGQPLMICNTGYYMYPRSSISKSNLRLANNVGIIDAGYRGHLMGMFDVVYADNMMVNKYDRHLQICAPDLMPIIIDIVETKEELGDKTVRNDGGFGSTGV